MGNKMTQIHGVAISRPLAVGSVAVLCSIFIHVLAIVATVRFFVTRENVAAPAQACLSIFQFLC
jgi:hypothetical protein